MTLTYDITMTEMLVFQRRILRRNKFIRGTVWVFRWLLPLVLLVPLVAQPYGKVSLYVIAGVLAGSVYLLWVWLFPKVYYGGVMLTMKGILKRPANALMFKTRTLTFDGEGVTVTTDVSTDRLLWAGFNGYEELDSLFILYITELTGHIIPKRALAEGQSKDLSALLAANITHG